MNTVLTLIAMVAIMVAPFALGAALSAITRNPGARNDFGDSRQWTSRGNFDWTDVGDSRDLVRAAHDLAAVRSRFE